MIRVACLALFPTVAWAIPSHLNAQGRLLDVSGTPVNGTLALSFGLYAAATGGAPVWTESHASVTVASGYYDVALGDVVAIDGSVLATPALWLEVTVGGGAPMARTPVASVLSARLSDHIPVSASVSGSSCTDTGQILWDTTATALRVCDGTTWQLLSNQKTILSTGTSHTWSDGTVATSCDAYRNPAAPFAYTGSTGSGTYRIDPDGVAGPRPAVDVTCDMVTGGGGWTQISSGGGYGARGDQFLIFDGLDVPFTELWIQHQSGATQCNTSQAATNGWAACNAITTGACGFVLSSGPASAVYSAGSFNGCPVNGGYTVTGTAAFGDRTLTRAAPATLAANSRLAYFEDWVNASETDNGGTHFVDLWIR